MKDVTISYPSKINSNKTAVRVTSNTDPVGNFDSNPVASCLTPAVTLSKIGNPGVERWERHCRSKGQHRPSIFDALPPEVLATAPGASHRTLSILAHIRLFISEKTNQVWSRIYFSARSFEANQLAAFIFCVISK